MPDMITVTTEPYDHLPLFDYQTMAGWVKGVTLKGIRAHECTTKYSLDPATLEVRSGTGADAQLFERGKDYDADLDWGTVGRRANGLIGEKQPVFIDYRYVRLRIDSIVLTPENKIVLRKGEPDIATPHPPLLCPGEAACANVWINGRLAKLTADNLFPILETAYPEAFAKTTAAQFLINTMHKLRQGGQLKILAWGDSVTDGSFLPNMEHDRWQAQFVRRLQERFPQAKIELVTEAWPGKTTAAYLAEPAGSVHNYREKVLAVKPDLIISEFVNDAGLDMEKVKEQYAGILANFRAIGAEWIILTPHYVHPDWMNLSREREIDDDPRPYVAMLRDFAAKKGVALADASLRYGRLWRQGIPYTSLLYNNINHPDARGMKIFADSLMALFS